MKSYILLFVLISSVWLLQQSDYAIENYDIIIVGSGATLYYILSCLKLIFLKKKFDVNDILLTAIVTFLVGFGQKMVGAWIYPAADKNKDGLLTRKEFEDWKRSM